MQDIADRVGVHRVTVSNVLNGKLKGLRSDALKRADEIRRVAAELGFRPSAAARATRTGRTGFIGVLSGATFANSVHFPEFELGLQQAAYDRGLCLVKDRLDENPDGTVTRLPRVLREDVVDGLLINYAFGTPPAVRRVLERCRIPAIWINRKREHNCVHPADEGAAFEATCHLLRHGHTDIAYLCGEGTSVQQRQEPHYSVADRKAGYSKAMIDAGLQPRIITEPPRRGGLDVGIGELFRFFTAVLSSSDRPTAVVCGSGGGRTMLTAAARLGLRVPEDLSVITFDNNAAMDLEITVDRVLVPNQAMGRVAVSELSALIEEPDEPRPPVVIPFEFHITGSVARPTSNNRRGHVCPRSLYPLLEERS
jgi:LacI family transcriptional regulator